MIEDHLVARPSPVATVGSELGRWFDNREFASRAPSGGAQARPQSRRVAWARVVPFLAMHAVCLAVIWVGFSRVALAVTIGLYVVRMFAITGFYHRYFSHRTFKTSRAAQFAFGLLGASAVQRGPIWWAAHHRHHHAHSDKPDDVHSPQHSFLWSHMGWFMSSEHFAADPSAAQLLRGDGLDPSLGKYLEREAFSRPFVDHYIVPMGAAVWSSRPADVLRFPARFFAEFFSNHGFLSVNDRPTWRVIRGGSREYVKKLTAAYATAAR
jgi:hypothetical protein